MAAYSRVSLLTCKLGLRSNLGEKFSEVGEIARKELGLEDDVLARVCRGNFTAQQFDFPIDPQCRALQRRLLH